MSIKNVIKQPGPVDAGLVPVQSGQGRSVPVGAGAVRCRPVPVPLTDRKKRCTVLFVKLEITSMSKRCITRKTNMIKLILEITRNKLFKSKKSERSLQKSLRIYCQSVLIPRENFRYF
jgi:hypothetical protein